MLSELGSCLYFSQLANVFFVSVLTVDLYDLLTKDQREQIADMMMEAMEDNYIFPEIWEMKVEAIIDSETDQNDIQ